MIHRNTNMNQLQLLEQILIF